MLRLWDDIVRGLIHIQDLERPLRKCHLHLNLKDESALNRQ